MDFALGDERPLKFWEVEVPPVGRSSRCVSKRTGFARGVFSGGSVAMLDRPRVPQRGCHGYPNRDLAAQGDLPCCSSEVVGCVTSPRRPH